MWRAQAWRLNAYGEGGDPAAAIKALKLEDIPVPEPAKGEVRVKVEIASCNPIDWKLFSGGLDGVCPCTFPYTPGFDIAGTVDALGEGVDSFKVGDAVIADIGLRDLQAPAARRQRWRVRAVRMRTGQHLCLARRG